MYDYRLPRHLSKKTKARALKSKKSFSLGGFFASIIRTIAYAVAALIILTISGYFLARILLPMALPLERDQVVAFVETANPQRAVTVVAFKASEGALVAAHLNSNVTPQLPPETSNPTATWSQNLQFVVDDVIIVPSGFQVKDSAQLTGLLWQGVQQAKPKEWLQFNQVRLWAFAQTVPSAKQRWFEVESVAQWDRTKFQLVLGDSFTKCSVGVINTTKTSGLATRFSALIEQSGYPVVRLSDNQENLDQSVVYFDPLESECALEAERLSQILTNPPELEANAELVKRHRAQIVIYLGQDT